MTAPDTHLFLDSLQTYPLDPVGLRRIFLILTRLHYSNPRNYGLMEQVLKNIFYSPDPALNRLAIFLEEAVRLTPESLFPAIGISVPGLKLERRVISDRAGLDGERGLVAQSPLAIHHYSQNADEAMTLAAMTCAFFTGFGEQLRDRMRLVRFQPEGITGPTNVKEASQEAFMLYRASFTALIHYDYSWVTTFESHLIANITIAATGQFDT